LNTKIATQFRLSDSDIDRLDQLVSHATELARENGIGSISRATVVRALLYVGLEIDDNDFIESIKQAKISA
jgi:hypothetical protein